MKEDTRIITAEITCVFKAADATIDTILKEKDAIAGAIKKCMPKDIDADDVTVIKIQDFVRDIKPQE